MRSRALARAAVLFSALLVGATLVHSEAANGSAPADGITYRIEGGADEAGAAGDGAAFLDGLDSVSLNSLLAWSIGALRASSLPVEADSRSVRSPGLHALRRLY